MSRWEKSLYSKIFNAKEKASISAAKRDSVIAECAEISKRNRESYRIELANMSRNLS